ncbi:Octapeptide-repeat protein T2, partial [Ophiophagus hannah]
MHSVLGCSNGKRKEGGKEEGRKAVRRREGGIKACRKESMKAGRQAGKKEGKKEGRGRLREGGMEEGRKEGGREGRKEGRKEGKGRRALRSLQDVGSFPGSFIMWTCGLQLPEFWELKSTRLNLAKVEKSCFKGILGTISQVTLPPPPKKTHRSFPPSGMHILATQRSLREAESSRSLKYVDFSYERNERRDEERSQLVLTGFGELVAEILSSSENQQVPPLTGPTPISSLPSESQLIGWAFFGCPAQEN